MSEKPLFQNADEQEAAYAPQELPQDSAGGTGMAETAPVAAALGSGSGRLGPEPSATTASTLNTGVDPEVGAAALAGRAVDEADETPRDDTDERR